jgi:GNAT superfamily N-acetyltransferase
MDMLVKLYSLGSIDTYEARIAIESIEVRRALAHERDAVIDWVRRNFEKERRAWGSEAAAAFSRTPSSCHIAVRDSEILGFACHDVTARGFFGPTGVAKSSRGIGVGAALLRVALQAMAAEGYGYAIIGGVSESGLGFYRNVVGATVIADSTPGIYPSNPLS